MRGSRHLLQGSCDARMFNMGMSDIAATWPAPQSRYSVDESHAIDSAAAFYRTGSPTIARQSRPQTSPAGARMGGRPDIESPRVLTSPAHLGNTLGSLRLPRDADVAVSQAETLREVPVDSPHRHTPRSQIRATPGSSHPSPYEHRLEDQIRELERYNHDLESKVHQLTSLLASATP